MKKSIEEAIQEIKIVKQNADSDAVEIASEHEVCGSHTRYADN